MASASASAPSVIGLECEGRVAIITINNPRKLGALSQQQYYDLSQKLREVAARPDVYITLIIGTGRYFSAYVLTTPPIRFDRTIECTCVSHIAPGSLGFLTRSASLVFFTLS